MLFVINQYDIMLVLLNLRDNQIVSWQVIELKIPLLRLIRVIIVTISEVRRHCPNPTHLTHEQRLSYHKLALRLVPGCKRSRSLQHKLSFGEVA